MVARGGSRRRGHLEAERVLGEPGIGSVREIGAERDDEARDSGSRDVAPPRSRTVTVR